MLTGGVTGGVTGGGLLELPPQALSSSTSDSDKDTAAEVRS